MLGPQILAMNCSGKWKSKVDKGKADIYLDTVETIQISIFIRIVLSFCLRHTLGLPSYREIDFHLYRAALWKTSAFQTQVAAFEYFRGRNSAKSAPSSDATSASVGPVADT